MVDLKELDKLQTLIESEPLMWGCCKRSSVYDGQEIRFFDPKDGHIISDVCCHGLSEGGLQGLLEQRLLIPSGEEKQGRLTAETVFNRWLAYFGEEVIPF
jgi:hypothetical protein